MWLVSKQVMMLVNASRAESDISLPIRLGCLHFVLVHAANVQDRNGIKQVLPLFKNKVLRGIKKNRIRCRVQWTTNHILGEKKL